MIQSPNDLIVPVIVVSALAVVIFFVWFPIAMASMGHTKPWIFVVGVIDVALCVIGLGLLIFGMTWDSSLDKTMHCEWQNNAYHCETVYTDSGIVVR